MNKFLLINFFTVSVEIVILLVTEKRLKNIIKKFDFFFLSILKYKIHTSVVYYFFENVVLRCNV